MGLEVERRTDRSEPALVRGSRETKTLGDLIQLHRGDLLDGRSAEKSGNNQRIPTAFASSGEQRVENTPFRVRQIAATQCRPLKIVARGAGHPIDLLTPS